MKLKIGFSPCPNDTFIFDALVNGKIDTGSFTFEPVLEDVETLNQWALEGKLDITKLSFPAFFQSLENYCLLEAGSALGKGVGPLLVAAQPINNDASQIEEAAITLPGQHTTAHLLFSFAFPKATQKKFQLFSQIEEEVLKGNTTLGVIIHENRFTYAAKGLHKVMDLGEHWENKMKAPVPLGGIAIKRNIPLDIALAVNQIIAKSLHYAWDHQEISSFVKEHAQSMEPSVMQQHIDLYVNQFSLRLGTEGHKAIQTLHEVFIKIQPSPAEPRKELNLFLPI
jgi:1,4-dihydroxy-6-naphthoate synthase